MRLHDYIGYDKWQRPSWSNGWDAWLGPIHVIRGTACSIWIWKLLITIDTFAGTFHADWNPD